MKRNLFIHSLLNKKRTMTNSRLFSKLLDMKQPMSNRPTRFSSIILLLKSGRKLFGCDINTGEYKMKEYYVTNFSEETYYSFQFSGLINYLIFLEQIGSIFKLKNCDNLKESYGINAALTHFSSITDNAKINAIVSLRNSLIHRFGLATEKNPKNKPPRKFILSIERNSDIVKLPNIEWDGTFSNKLGRTSTTIFIVDLVILIETVYQKICEENKKNNLDIKLKDGIDELKTRYTLIV